MPPKAKITKEMVIEAAYEIARTEGAENINARTVSQRLGCSTQPVMYHFATIEDLKRAVYGMVDWYHSAYLMRIDDENEDVMLGIGLNYIRFAVEEPNLFRFLFQSGFAVERSLLDMIDSEELMPVISVMQDVLQMDVGQTKKVFVSIAVFAHGYASIIANNSLEYDEKIVATHLDRAYRGAVSAVMEESK